MPVYEIDGVPKNTTIIDLSRLRIQLAAEDEPDRTSNEENDIVCLNQSNHPFWDRQGLVILVECKDYGKKKPGDNERGRLERKIRSRQGQSTVGIFVSPSGFAKTFLAPKDITRRGDALTRARGRRSRI
jgi:hypothetical protein